MDNYVAHKSVEVRDWFAANPRIIVHLTPTSVSWLNLVESWFGITERQAIHRGTYGSVTDPQRHHPPLYQRLERTLDPFKWTKPADESSPNSNQRRLHALSTRPFAYADGECPRKSSHNVSLLANVADEFQVIAAQQAETCGRSCLPS